MLGWNFVHKWLYPKIPIKLLLIVEIIVFFIHGWHKHYLRGELIAVIWSFLIPLIYNQILLIFHSHHVEPFLVNVIVVKHVLEYSINFYVLCTKLHLIINFTSIGYILISLIMLDHYVIHMFTAWDHNNIDLNGEASKCLFLAHLNILHHTKNIF